MPGLNGTGPVGAGPMTGGGRGYCGRSDVGAQQFPNRRGLGRGRGFGRKQGFGRRMTGTDPAENVPQYNQPDRMNPEDEIRMLKLQTEEMQSALEDIRKRMMELNKTPEA